MKAADKVKGVKVCYYFSAWEQTHVAYKSTVRSFFFKITLHSVLPMSIYPTYRKLNVSKKDSS